MPFRPRACEREHLMSEWRGEPGGRHLELDRKHAMLSNCSSREFLAPNTPRNLLAWAPPFGGRGGGDISNQFTHGFSGSAISGGSTAGRRPPTRFVKSTTLGRVSPAYYPFSTEIGDCAVPGRVGEYARGLNPGGGERRVTCCMRIQRRRR